MFNLKEKSNIRTNVAYSVLAQLVGLVSSLLMSVLVPKALGLSDYSYWQLFVFYMGYVGMGLLGVNDGLFLRLGGERIEDVDQDRVKTELVVVTLVQVAIALGLFILTYQLQSFDSSRLFSMTCVALYTLICNPASLLFYLYQATNLMHVYSTATLLSRTAFIAFLGVALVLRVDDFKVYIVGYMICQLISTVYCFICGKRFLSARYLGLKQGLSDALVDIRSGMKVMLAYYAGSLIIGAGRIMIDAHWGVEAFGIFSFSISLINFALVFAGQLSLVLFPAIKRMEGVSRDRAFADLRAILFIGLPIVYLAYAPVCSVLSVWLPQYESSFLYLGLLLPICIFDCKMNLLYNTYFKALRREGSLLVINAITMSVSFACVGIGVWLFNNVVIAALGMVLAIALRNAFAEIALRKQDSGHWGRSYASELALATCFIISSYYFDESLFVVFPMILYYVINREDMKKVFLTFKNQARKNDAKI